MKKVVVIGGGLSGLAAAWMLQDHDFDVTVLEKEPELGGLASCYNLSGVWIPKTYHHAIGNDQVLLETLDALGIPVTWKEVDVGFNDGTLTYPFKKPTDLLKFKPLSMIQRLRFGWLVLSAIQGWNWPGVHESVESWVTRTAGVQVYLRLVKPLVESYFGAGCSVAARYLANRFHSESASIKQLGHTDFHQLVQKLSENVNCVTGVDVTRINDHRIIGQRNGGLGSITEFYPFDYVVSAIPVPTLARVLPENSLPFVPYRGCVCLMLYFKQKIPGYYWLNVLSNSWKPPFVSIFNCSEFNDLPVIYVVSYLTPHSEEWRITDASRVAESMSWLENMLSVSASDLVSYRVYRNATATPVYSTDYPNLPTQIGERIFLAGTSMIYPNIRMSGTSMQSGFKAAERIMEKEEK